MMKIIIHSIYKKYNISNNEQYSPDGIFLECFVKDFNNVL